MGAYSFKDTQATIAGPGGLVNLGDGAAVAEEGITIEAVEDKNVMTIGADGKGMHSLVASDARTITIRLLKNSPTNALLMLMYNLQSATSALWGVNVLTVVNTGLGDYTVVQQVAFRRAPNLNYAKEGGLVEWQLDGIAATSVLGAT